LTFVGYGQEEYKPNSRIIGCNIYLTKAEGDLSMAKRKTERRTSEKRPETAGPKSHILLADLLFIVMLMLSIFLFVGMINDVDQENTDSIGLLGKYIITFIHILFGKAAIGFPAFLLGWSIHMGYFRQKWSNRMWGLTVMFLIYLVVTSVNDIPRGISVWDAGRLGMGGGYLGGALGYFLIKMLGEIGTTILLVLSFFISLVLLLDKTIAEIFIKLWEITHRFCNKIPQLIYEEVEEEPIQTAEKVIVKENPKPLPIITAPEPIGPVIEEPGLEKKNLSKEKTSADNFADNRDLKINQPALAAANPASGYVKPSLDLLNNISSERLIDKKNIKNNISILEETFKNFGISVRVNQVSCGPAVTRYELTPAPGVKVSKILNLTDDLQLSLAASGIRIEAPIPGKSAVGIEIPNPKVNSVGLRNLLSSSAFQKINSPLAFALGEDIAGNAIVAQLSDMPHLLIAGSTGSGKSVCINCIIMSLLFNASPEEVKMVFIDPKMVELTVYNGLPHLLTPVVTDPKRAAAILKWMTLEMEKRYKAFAEAGVRDIYRYREVASENMPFIVIIIDELADLMMVAPADVEDSICRLAQMARAAGIHLIVATQRPSVDVVTGIIKANIPSRIAFAVSSQMDSRTILDMGGAEKLLGKGDMLFLPVGANKPLRIQGAFVSDEEIERTVKFIVDQATECEFNEELEKLDEGIEGPASGGEDELFWEAARVFVETRKASVSLLQRKLRIGYSRAARLVDEMEEKGIVSALDSNKKRNVLITEEQFERLYKQNIC